jgi:hypothetical protein
MVKNAFNRDVVPFEGLLNGQLEDPFHVKCGAMNV